MVRQKTSAAGGDMNAALVRAVFEELRIRAPGGIRYASDDSRTASHSFTSLPSRRRRSTRCRAPRSGVSVAVEGSLRRAAGGNGGVGRRIVRRGRVVSTVKGRACQGCLRDATAVHPRRCARAVPGDGRGRASGASSLLRPSTGSVIEGEDIVQDTLAKAFYALSLSEEVPLLRPWLFRIAHNAAMDFLKSHGNKYTDATAEIRGLAGFEDKPDPAVVRAALACFLSLPVAQRSAVILKDVLGHSLEETAETMGRL